jgi:4-amino-4-deoxy-L-arabinose transferase-like glycosyltransferase
MLVGILGLAATQHVWNAFGVPPLTGYDAPGHAGYVLTILNEGRLPHPYQGWSTFHPPLYYLLGAGLYWGLDPLGPHAVLGGLRLPGVVGSLVVGGLSFWALRRQGYELASVAVATALVLFVPAAQLSAAMVGNEAFAAGLVALALAAALRLMENPEDVGMAVAAGAAAGLAISTKYTAALVVLAAAAPFAIAVVERRRLERGLVRAALVFGLCVAVLGGPTYLRNLAVTSALVPMTRDREPMRRMEANLVLRERRLSDFVTVPTSCLRRPSLFHEAGKPGSFRNRNPDMTSVWCLTYAGAWNDVFGHRTPVRDHRDDFWLGPTLAGLGLVPTLLMLFGFGAAVVVFVRRKGRTPDAPLVVMGVLGLVMYVAIAATAPSAAAVKASYLLGLGLPAAAFYARGVAWLPRRWLRQAALAISATAALVAAAAFTNGVAFPPPTMGLRVWRDIARELPYSHIMEALERIGVAWYQKS